MRTKSDFFIFILKIWECDSIIIVADENGTFDKNNSKRMYSKAAKDGHIFLIADNKSTNPD